MTDFTANSSVSHPRGFALLPWIAQFFRGLTSGYQAYRTYERLSRKNDSELAAIGLTRADLPRVAAEELLDAN
ncbi:MAG: hypothetical protein LJE68_01175 [Rhodobacter sp.]|nr:hypothetical protein [Rhodobacter sp.]